MLIPLRTARYHGFTLIELLVAITILLLVTGGALAGFSNFYSRRNVQETALTVRQFFVSAQQKASVKETPDGCRDATSYPLRAYRVDFPSSSSVRVRALCLNTTVAMPFPATPTSGTGEYITVDSYTFPSGVTVSPTTAIDFYTLEGGTNTGAIYRFDGAQDYQFTVSKGGTISSVEKAP